MERDTTSMKREASQSLIPVWKQSLRSPDGLLKSSPVERFLSFYILMNMNLFEPSICKSDFLILSPQVIPGTVPDFTFCYIFYSQYLCLTKKLWRWCSSQL